MNNTLPLRYPAPLKDGDKIVFCTPAGTINAEKVHKAAQVLRDQGWKVQIMPHALGRHGSYSGTADERYNDLSIALLDPEVRAIICSRGGYGVIHILDRLDRLDLRKDPKWIVGFSDISALHALMNKKGIASIHSNMAAGIMAGADDPDNAALFGILRGNFPAYTFKGHRYDRCGVASGTLLGGNLAVISGLINTPYDIIKPDTILFIEDIAEPIYKIERILWQLKMNGVLGRLKGLIVGQFTDYKPDVNHKNMYEMIHEMVADYDYPVAYDVAIGHVDHNLPLIESAPVTLKVSHEGNNSIVFHRSPTAEK